MAESSVARFRWILSGRVQGVGFRWFTREAARELGLRGSVRNRADGTVEIEVVGPEDAVEVFRSRVRAGPRGGRVEGFEESELPEDREPGPFEVRY